MDFESLVARPIPGLLPVVDLRAPLRVVIASLAPGGAERIVLDWLGAERSRGRDAELAVLYRRRNSLPPAQGVAVRMRSRVTVEEFLAGLAHEWQAHPAPVCTHLVPDELLEIFWRAGVRTIPTVHNSSPGWRNDAAAWREERVPMAIACAESVRRELVDTGCTVPLVTLRHRPRVGAAAFDLQRRAEIRDELRIPHDMFLVGAIGAVKAQKDYARAIEVLSAVAKHRPCALVILGGVLDAAGLAELDRVMQRAIDLRVADRLRLPGFVRPVEPWLAACDAIVNVSRFEGLSIGVQEALAAGLPVVATAVGGQEEIEHAGLSLVAPGAASREVAALLCRLPVRTALESRPFERAPRAWSIPTFPRAPSGPHLETLFVTANLNCGGAQRSLVNLACAIGPLHRLAVAVCGETTHAAFASQLLGAGIEVFRPAAWADPFAIAESLLAHAQSRGASTICFWNADARVKLLVAKFAPRGVAIVDASPGDYAFDEMRSASAFASSVAASAQAYYERLDTLVLKHRGGTHPPCRRVEFIPNGVEYLAQAPRPDRPRFLVSGRLAPSKRLQDIIAAFVHVREILAAAELHLFGNVEERHRDYAAALGCDAPGVILRGPSFDHAHFREPWCAAIVIGTNQGSPNAVLEAMAAGVAVIANDSGGTREAVATGETGWLLREDASPTDIAAAMREAAGDLSAACRLGAQARERVRARNTIAEMARRYLAILAPGNAAAHEKMAAWNRAIESPITCASPASSP